MTPSGRGWVARASARLDVVAAPLCRWLTVVAAGCLAVMAVLTVLDVLGRYLLNRPLPGALELSEFTLGLLVFFGLGLTGLTGGQVVVDILYERFPPRLRAGADAVNAALGVALWALIAWRSAEQAWHVRLRGEVSTVLGLPTYPFLYATALGCAVMALALVSRFLAALGRPPAR